MPLIDDLTKALIYLQEIALHNKPNKNDFPVGFVSSSRKVHLIGSNETIENITAVVKQFTITIKETMPYYSNLNELEFDMDSLEKLIIATKETNSELSLDYVQQHQKKNVQYQKNLSSMREIANNSILKMAMLTVTAIKCLRKELYKPEITFDEGRYDSFMNQQFSEAEHMIKDFNKININKPVANNS